MYRPGQFDRITVPTLLLSGSDSPPDVKKATDDAAAAIPDARVHVLAGHAHIAHRTDPALVAAIIREFLAPRASPGSTRSMALPRPPSA